MGAVSGNGGGLYIQRDYPGDPDDQPLDPAQFEDTNNVHIPISKWTLGKNPRLREVTRTWNRGSRYKSDYTDPAVEIELPLDELATLENAGLDRGDRVALALFKCGKSNLAADPDNDPPDPLYYMLLETTVDEVGVVCDVNGDVLRYRLALKGGDVSGPDTLSGLGLTVTVP